MAGKGLAGEMNWRRGFFRIWLLASILWILGIAAAFWTDAAKQFELARLSDEELISQRYPVCRQLPNPPPKGFILDECADALQKAGINPFDVYDIAELRRWGRGNSYVEQSMRMISVAPPMLALLLGPPFCILLFGIAVGWVLSGFTSSRDSVDTK
jgi:hypothetical protein